MFVHASVQSTHQSERGEKWLAGGGLCSGSELILASQVTKGSRLPRCRNRSCSRSLDRLELVPVD
jgi:hypothetical protein